MAKNFGPEFRDYIRVTLFIPRYFRLRLLMTTKRAKSTQGRVPKVVVSAPNSALNPNSNLILNDCLDLHAKNPWKCYKICSARVGFRPSPLQVPYFDIHRLNLWEPSWVQYDNIKAKER